MFPKGRLRCLSVVPGRASRHYSRCSSPRFLRRAAHAGRKRCRHGRSRVRGARGLCVSGPREPDCVRNRVARDGVWPGKLRHVARRDAPSRGRDQLFLWGGGLAPPRYRYTFGRTQAAAVAGSRAGVAPSRAAARRAHVPTGSRCREKFSACAVSRESRAGLHGCCGNAPAAPDARIRDVRVSD